MATISPKSTDSVKKNAHLSPTVSKQSNGSVDTTSKSITKNSTDAAKSPLKKSTSDNQKVQISKVAAESKVTAQTKIVSSIRSTTESTAGVTKLARSSSAKSISIPLKSIFTLSSTKVTHGESSSNGENIKNSQMDVTASGDHCEILDKQKVLEEIKSPDKKNQHSDEHVENGEVSVKTNGEGVNDAGEPDKIIEIGAADLKPDDVEANESEAVVDNKSTIKIITAENGHHDEYVPNGDVAQPVEVTTQTVKTEESKLKILSESLDEQIVTKEVDETKIKSELKDEIDRNESKSPEDNKKIIDEITDEKSSAKGISSSSDLSHSSCSSESEISKETSTETVVRDVDGEKVEQNDLKVKEEVVVSKSSIRLKVWEELELNNLVLFPRPCKGRIPNFVGAPQAAEKLAKMDIFKNSKVIKVNPDKPQEAVRFLTLECGKRLLVPVPRLRQGLFQAVMVPPNADQYILKNASQQVGMLKYSKPVRLDDHIHIDLIILGSVAVDIKGHRIGKGEGYADLEFALMMKMNAVNENTVIATTVHDSQVMDDLPEHLFKEHDVPVDWIITPTRIIEVSEKLPRPRTIIWDILSQRRVLEIPILQFLRERELSEGKDCILKEVDSDTENKPFVPRPYRRYNNRRRQIDYSRSTGDPKRDFRTRYPSENRYVRNNTRNVVNTNRYPSARRGGVNSGGITGYYRPSNGPSHMNGPPPLTNQWSSYNNGNNYRPSRNGPLQTRNGPLQVRNGPLPSRNGPHQPRNQSLMDRRPRTRSTQRMEDRRPRSRPAVSRQRAPSYNNNRRRSSARLSTDRKKSISPEQDHSPVDVSLTSTGVAIRKVNRSGMNAANQSDSKRSKPRIAFSIRLRNIEPGVRVRDLKTALKDRGVKPRDITWRGYKGTALLHFTSVTKNTKQNSAEEMISLLQGLSLKPKPIENQLIIIEEAKKPSPPPSSAVIANDNKENVIIISSS